MVQKINSHPAQGCNRSPPYYVFSKDAILGSVLSISSEVLGQIDNYLHTLNILVSISPSESCSWVVTAQLEHFNRSFSDTLVLERLFWRLDGCMIVLVGTGFVGCWSCQTWPADLDLRYRGSATATLYKMIEQFLLKSLFTKMEFTVRYTRQITAIFTDISIKINRFVCIKQAKIFGYYLTFKLTF